MGPAGVGQGRTGPAEADDQGRANGIGAHGAGAEQAGPYGAGAGADGDRLSRKMGSRENFEANFDLSAWCWWM